MKFQVFVVHELSSPQLGQQEQYSVKLGYTNLNTDTVQTHTCPSPTSAPIQLPAVKCESANMTVTLAAKELQMARLIGKINSTEY